MIELVEALEAQPITNDGETAYCIDGDYLTDQRGLHIGLSSFFDLTKTWQPYTPPPAEGSREWAMEQDAKVRYANWPRASFVHKVDGEWITQDGADYSDNMRADIWGDEWSIYVEPRTPGLYSAQPRKGDNVQATEWTGEFWVIDNEMTADADVHWASDNLIVLDTPDK
jgi:hypothetical protein